MSTREPSQDSGARRKVALSAAVVVGLLAVVLTSIRLLDPAAEPGQQARSVGAVPGRVNVASFDVQYGDDSDQQVSPDSAQRMTALLRALADNNLDLVGLQGANRNDLVNLALRTTSRWGTYPRRSLTGSEPALTVLWRASRWHLVRGESVEVPRPTGGTAPQPLVLLRHHTSGRLLWVANFRNLVPSNPTVAQRAWLRSAIAAQVDAVRDRLAQGHPVLVTGAHDDGGEFSCALTAATGLAPTSGGTRNASTCTPPTAGGPGWIFLGNGVAASEAASYRGPAVRVASDKRLYTTGFTLPPLATATARIATYNVLGHSHTAPGGKLARWDAGPERMHKSMRLLERLGITAAGLQEFQRPQFDAFAADWSERWRSFPTAEASSRDLENAVIWRDDVWELLSATTVAMPYFNGNLRRMPLVHLRDRATGQTTYLANFHNPATTRKYRGSARWRAEAVRRQITLANQLQAETGQPVVFTGDMNDREEFFCPITSGTQLKASNGGSVSPQPCDPPSPMAIDWIMGSPEVQFSGHVLSREPQRREISDHPLIYTDLSIAPPQPIATRVASVNAMRAVPPGSGLARGTERIATVLELLEAARVELVGFQELNTAMAQTVAQSGWRLFPGPGRGEEQVAWDDDTWRVIATRPAQTRARTGQVATTPTLLLRHRASGRLIYLSSFHVPQEMTDPAELAAAQEQVRADQAELLALGAAESRPVLITGTMEPAATYFCELSKLSVVTGVFGGRAGDDGCAAPPVNSASWIVTSPLLEVGGARLMRGTKIRTATDQPPALATLWLERTAGAFSGLG